MASWDQPISSNLRSDVGIPRTLEIKPAFLKTANRHQLTMIATVAPEYQLAVHVTVSNGWRLPYIKIAEPYAYIGDLYHNGEQELLKLIQSLEAILTGQSSELVDFAWERVICTTEGELTYCEDMHTQAHCIVKTRWMLQMLKDFYAFRMQFR